LEIITTRRIMTTQTRALQNKSLCALEGCPSIASKTIELKPLIDKFIDDTSKDNPETNPLCIKRIVSELLTEESARLFVEFMKGQK